MLEIEFSKSPENGEDLRPAPYVVSEDIGLLLTEWCDRKGFVMPEPEFIGGLRAEFNNFMTRIFPGFEMVPEKELSEGLTKLVEQTGLFPVSLDRVYCSSGTGLDLTRLVDKNRLSKGLGRRADSSPLCQVPISLDS